MKRATDLMLGLVLIALFALIGDFIVLFTGAPVPGAILGMLTFAIPLWLSPGLRARVRTAATLLTGYLGAMIIPPFIGLALFRDDIGAHGPALLLILLVTTPLTGLLTAFAYRRLARTGPRTGTGTGTGTGAETGAETGA